MAQNRLFLSFVVKKVAQSVSNLQRAEKCHSLDEFRQISSSKTNLGKFRVQKGHLLFIQLGILRLSKRNSINCRRLSWDTASQRVN